MSDESQGKQTGLTTSGAALPIQGASGLVRRGLDALLKQDPDVLYERGLAYFAAGNHRAAIAEFTAAIGLDPSYAPAYRERADAYQEINDLPAAMVDLIIACRLAPQDADVDNLLFLVSYDISESPTGVGDLL